MLCIDMTVADKLKRYKQISFNKALSVKDISLKKITLSDWLPVLITVSERKKKKACYFTYVKVSY